MTDKGKDEENDWEFNKLELPTQTEAIIVPVKGLVKNKKSQLILDEAPPLKTKTRSAMAIELQNLQEIEEEDIYQLASLPKRGIAFIIDMVILLSLLYFINFSTPYLRVFLQNGLDIYNLEFIIPEFLVMKSILLSFGFFVLFSLIIIPVSFFNHSLGKKLVGLKVRGTDKYTISIANAFKREIVLKPLSIIIIAGFVTPFFNKKRQSVHDMLTKTFVTQD